MTNEQKTALIDVFNRLRDKEADLCDKMDAALEAGMDKRYNALSSEHAFCLGQMSGIVDITLDLLGYTPYIDDEEILVDIVPCCNEQEDGV